MISKEDLIQFEKGIASRFDDGEIPYLIHLSGGNEDQLISIFSEINEGDYVFSTHRSHYHYLLIGGSPSKLEDMIMSGNSMFVFDKDLNFYTSSIVGATPSIAAGVAWALKRKGKKARVWCFVGDGAEDEGHFYEAVRYVDGNDLPCIFIIEDNDRSVVASKKDRWGTDRIFPWPGCVRRYRYTSTWPHGGSGNWANLWKEPKIREQVNYYPIYGIGLGDPSELSYGEAVRNSMNMLAKEVNATFVGYNVKYGSACGMLEDVDEDQKLEAPLAENLMLGLAMGMSLEGIRPVVYFERHDFVFNAMDAIVNQLDRIKFLSDGQFNMPVIIKAVAGGTKPFYAGITHVSDLTILFRRSFSFPIYVPKTPSEVLDSYRIAAKADYPILVIEEKKLY